MAVTVAHPFAPRLRQGRGFRGWVLGQSESGRQRGFSPQRAAARSHSDCTEIASAPVRGPSRIPLIRPWHDQIAFRDRGWAFRNPARPGAKSVSRSRGTTRARAAEVKPKETAVRLNAPAEPRSPTPPAYETSTTTAVILSLPPRVFAISIRRFTEKWPPSARIGGISSVRR